jgi:GGDEF domain-containing protein
MPTYTVMSDVEIALWSACLGIYLSYALLSGVYAAYNRSVSGIQTMIYVVLTGVFVLCASGLLRHFAGLSPKPQMWLTLASGPVAASVSAYGLHNFLRGEMRDTLVGRGMQVVTAFAALLLLGLFWPDPVQALEWVGLGVGLVAVGAFWLTLRSWLLGDRLALAMTLACTCLAFAVIGLYANALGALQSNRVLQAATAFMSAAYIVIACHTLKRRLSLHLRMKKSLSMSRDKDLLTQLLTGAALIRQVDESVARARRNRKEMAVICVDIKNTSALRQEFGPHGLEQVIYGMAARVRQAAGGAASIVGRYSDSSFVVVLDSLKKSSVLRTLGLRLAVTARRPFVINPMSSSPGEFRSDIGVGVARISPGREMRSRRDSNSTQMGGSFDSFSLAQDALHEAAELAMEARKFNSRAAIVDAYSRKTVALESADFSTRNGRRGK